MADCTRPDISYVVRRLGAAATKQTTRHWNILKVTMRYLVGTRDLKMVFRNDEPEGSQEQRKETRITEIADTDCENDKADRWSVTGGIVRYNGCPVGWM